MSKVIYTLRCKNPNGTLTKGKRYRILRGDRDQQYYQIKNDFGKTVRVRADRFLDSSKVRIPENPLFLHVGNLPTENRTIGSWSNIVNKKDLSAEEFKHPTSLEQLLAIYFTSAERSQRTFYRHKKEQYTRQITGSSRSLIDLKILLSSYYPNMTEEQFKEIYDIMTSRSGLEKVRMQKGYCTTVERTVFYPNMIMNVTKREKLFKDLIKDTQLAKVKMT